MNFTDSENRPLQLFYASFGRRFMAWFIDSLILCLIYVLVINPLLRGVISEWVPKLIWGGSPSIVYHSLYLSPLILSILLAWFYYAGCEASTYQATLGKRCFHLKLADVQGVSVSFVKASARYWFRILLTWVPAFILILGSRIINLALSGAAPPLTISAIVLVVFIVGLVIGSVVDIVCIPFTCRKQPLHDLIAKTIVVEKAWSKPEIQEQSSGLSQLSPDP